MPTIIRDPLDVQPHVGTGYPAPYDTPCLARRRHRLGDSAGLKNFGVNYTVLPPGTMSSQRHWHSVQDEFVMVLSGELVLITNEGETLLRRGMSAGFPAGEQNGHHLVNRSESDAVYLEVGDRQPGDDGQYPDVDMKFEFVNGKSVFLRKDGSSFPPKA